MLQQKLPRGQHRQRLTEKKKKTYTLGLENALIVKLGCLTRDMLDARNAMVACRTWACGLASSDACLSERAGHQSKQ